MGCFGVGDGAFHWRQLGPVTHQRAGMKSDGRGGRGGVAGLGLYPQMYEWLSYSRLMGYCSPPSQGSQLRLRSQRGGKHTEKSPLLAGGCVSAANRPRRWPWSSPVTWRTWCHMAEQDAETQLPPPPPPNNLGSCADPVPPHCWPTGQLYPASGTHVLLHLVPSQVQKPPWAPSRHRLQLGQPGLGCVAGLTAPARLARPQLISPQKRCIFIALHLYFHVPSLQLC